METYHFFHEFIYLQHHPCPVTSIIFCAQALWIASPSSRWKAVRTKVEFVPWIKALLFFHGFCSRHFKKIFFFNIYCLLGGGFKHLFYFHPYLGKVPILTNVFQRGWNHQLIYCLGIRLEEANKILWSLVCSKNIHFKWKWKHVVVACEIRTYGCRLFMVHDSAPCFFEEHMYIYI